MIEVIIKRIASGELFMSVIESSTLTLKFFAFILRNIIKHTILYINISILYIIGKNLNSKKINKTIRFLIQFKG